MIRIELTEEFKEAVERYDLEEMQAFFKGHDIKVDEKIKAEFAPDGFEDFDLEENETLIFDGAIELVKNDNGETLAWFKGSYNNYFEEEKEIYQPLYEVIALIKKI